MLVRFTFVCLSAIAAISAMAQELPPPTLPPLRSVEHSPDVADVGRLSRTDATSGTVPTTATLAVSDLQLFDAALATRFPQSADAYPVDSIHAMRVARATAWITRLSAAAAPSGNQQLDFAAVAIAAEHDSLARRLIDARLRAMPASRATAPERSMALAIAIAVLTDLRQPARLLQINTRVANEYLAQLRAIPTTGYATRSDSTDILHRQCDAEVAFLLAGDALQSSEMVGTHNRSFLQCTAALGITERWSMIQRAYPYREVATALVAQPNGRAVLDSLNTRLEALLSPLAAERVSAGVAAHATNEVAAFHERVEWFDALGTLAPPITAHAWLNTATPAYASAPVTHTFAAGAVYLLAFGPAESGMLPILDRLHRTVPDNVHVLFVTQTTGTIGPDIAAPAAEVEWLTTYYRTKRHLTLPIAIWAGDRVRGDYGSSSPAPSPSAEVYHADLVNGMCIIIDKAGRIRAYADAVSRDDQSRLLDRVRAIARESGPDMNTNTSGRQ